MSLQAWLLTLFGRHSRLAIDAVPGIHHDFFSQKKEGEYVSGLKWRLQFAYKVAGREAIRQGKRHKHLYDTNVRAAIIQPGGRDLVRNVGLKGKQTLADRYIVIEQTNPKIPVFRV